MVHFAAALPPAAAALLPEINFLFGLGLVEDGYENTAIIEAITGDRLQQREVELQAEAKQLMARLPFPEIDVLIIERIGKDISGAGMDPNVIGRGSRASFGFTEPAITKIVALDLTAKTNGNACGIGLADVTTAHLFNQIDWEYTYANVIASAYLDAGAIPLVMKTEAEAIRLAVATVTRVKWDDLRIVHIRDTLTLDQMAVSAALLSQVAADERLTQIGPLAEMQFQADGRLVPLHGVATIGD